MSPPAAIVAIERTLADRRDDWDSWLVYADWLTDCGDARGTLITLEHTLATTSPERRERQQLRRQIQAIAAEHEAHWKAPWGERPCTLRFDSLSLQRDDDDSEIHSICTHRDARFLHTLSFEWSPQHTFLSFLQFLPSISVRAISHTLPYDVNDTQRAQYIQTLVTSTDLRMLTMLSLSAPRQNDSAFGDDAAVALAHSSSLATLTELRLRGYQLSQAGASALVHSTTLTSVISLVLEYLVHWNHSGDWLAEIVCGHTLPQPLQRLALQYNQIGVRGTAAIANATALRSLTELDLSHNAVGDAGAVELSRSTTLAGLHKLSLRACSIGVRGGRALERSTTLQRGVADWSMYEP